MNAPTPAEREQLDRLRFRPQNWTMEDLDWVNTDGVAFPRLAAVLRAAGYDVYGIDEDEDHGRWVVYSREEMVVSRDALLAGLERFSSVVGGLGEVSAIGIVTREDER